MRQSDVTSRATVATSIRAARMNKPHSGTLQATRAAENKMPMTDPPPKNQPSRISWMARRDSDTGTIPEGFEVCEFFTTAFERPLRAAHLALGLGDGGAGVLDLCGQVRLGADAHVVRLLKPVL